MAPHLQQTHGVQSVGDRGARRLVAAEPQRKNDGNDRRTDKDDKDDKDHRDGLA